MLSVQQPQQGATVEEVTVTTTTVTTTTTTTAAAPAEAAATPAPPAPSTSWWTRKTSFSNDLLSRSPTRRRAASQSGACAGSSVEGDDGVLYLSTPGACELDEVRDGARSPPPPSRKRGRLVRKPNIWPRTKMEPASISEDAPSTFSMTNGNPSSSSASRVAAISFSAVEASPAKVAEE